MSDHHHHDDDHQHGNDHKGDGESQSKGAADSEFLDLEISKVLYGEAEDVTREALRDLLKDAAKELLRERFGDRIDALAGLAIDELLADVEANIAIEGRIAERAEAREGLDKRARKIVHGDD